MYKTVREGEQASVLRWYGPTKPTESSEGKISVGLGITLDRLNHRCAAALLLESSPVACCCSLSLLLVVVPCSSRLYVQGSKRWEASVGFEILWTD